MLEFARTMMGRQFFDGMVPRLVRTLERIADAIEKHNAFTEEMLTPTRAKEPPWARIVCDECRVQVRSPRALGEEGITSFTDPRALADHAPECPFAREWWPREWWPAAQRARGEQP